jgi:hypothetical protein
MLAKIALGFVAGENVQTVCLVERTIAQVLDDNGGLLLVDQF